MNNRWIIVDMRNLKEGLDLMSREDLIKIVIDGAKVQSKASFMELVENALQFPTPCDGMFSRFEDWIRDLSWFPEEKGVCIWITDYEEFLLEDLRSKGILEKVLKDEVIPFWESDVVKYVKGGKPRAFYIIVS